MKPNISLLAPTRGRPKFVKEMVQSALETAENPELLQFVFYADADDKPTIDLFENGLDGITKNYTWVVGERIILSQMWNKCWELAEADVFMHAADDIRFRTKGWDSEVLNAMKEFDDRIVFVHGVDGYAPTDFGTHGFIHRNWTTTVGCFVPEYFSSDYNDTWLNDVAKGIGRHKSLSFYTEHLHPVIGKYHWDRTHIERLARGRLDKNKEKYENRATERQDWCDLLSNYIKEFE